jgi:PIN domain nuclease of toxin-antitoxin system
MRILLDTHILLWWLKDDARLPAMADRLISDPANTIFVSAVSIWEIAIKSGLGRLVANPAAVEAALEPSGFMPLPVSTQHAVAVCELPNHHRDPFDRLLLAQCRWEPMRLLTHDQVLTQYGDAILLV